MTSVLAVVAVAAAVAVAVLLLRERRLARRLLQAGRRLNPDVVPTGTGLDEATSLVERAIDRTLLGGAHRSVAEERLASALLMIPQGIVVFEPDGVMGFRNKAATRYLTARHGEALVEEVIDEIAGAVMSGGGRPSPSRTVDLFGPPRRTLVVRGFGVDHGDAGLGALVVIDDVTDRRRLEAVRRDFVTNISHELKTPVGGLALLAETLVAEDDPAVARRLAERMLTEAFRVGRTIDDLLELSRIEADEVGGREEVSVRSIVGEAADRVRGAADQRGIDIRVGDISERLVVLGDRRQLVSATYNLLENAVKYSEDGSPVSVRARTDGRFVEISVEDRGIGIPRRDLARVFERFYRVDRARSRETGGTGLGLAIVRHVANNHAGDVRVESTEGEGSTFTLRLPLGAGPVAVSPQAG
ncbi:MAG TPA: ATP-binding protein [Acidimicrobiales bacterium]|nr:ATP-binding protein [Acidimicrobiales bacterium]